MKMVIRAMCIADEDVRYACDTDEDNICDLCVTDEDNDGDLRVRYR